MSQMLLTIWLPGAHSCGFATLFTIRPARKKIQILCEKSKCKLLFIWTHRNQYEAYIYREYLLLMLLPVLVSSGLTKGRRARWRVSEGCEICLVLQHHTVSFCSGFVDGRTDRLRLCYGAMAALLIVQNCLTTGFWPTVLSVEPLARFVVCLSVCRLWRFVLWRNGTS